MKGGSLPPSVTQPVAQARAILANPGQMVKVDWADSVQFPFTITLPAILFHVLRSREITFVNPIDPVPAEIVNWMKSDLRYVGLFKPAA